MDENVWRIADNIDGWFTHKEAVCLDQYNTGTWCEVGCWKGRSTIILANKSKGYAVDWFKGSSEHAEGTNTYQEFKENIKPWKHNITVLRKKYQNAVKDVPMVDLLFLDAEHSYEATKEAFELYAPKVKKGGHIIFHDAWGHLGERENAPWPGVTQFCRELQKHPKYKLVDEAERNAVFQKL